MTEDKLEVRGHRTYSVPLDLDKILKELLPSAAPPSKFAPDVYRSAADVLRPSTPSALRRSFSYRFRPLPGEDCWTDFLVKESLYQAYFDAMFTRYSQFNNTFVTAVKGASNLGKNSMPVRFYASTKEGIRIPPAVFESGAHARVALLMMADIVESPNPENP